MTDASNRVSTFTKFGYGVGLGAEGIKNNTFNVFLLFFYQQVIGLSTVLCGLALFVTLLVDAVADPFIGTWSDGLRSKLGRRLPFMYAAGVPLAICFFCVFHPPLDASQAVLFAWVVFFAAATRVSMSLFWLPHQSLVVELTEDFAERTSLQNFRNIFAWLFGLLNVWLGYYVFLASTPEYELGLLNREGYTKFALWGALGMLVATFASTSAVRPAVLKAPATHRPITPIPLREFPKAMARAIKANPSYRAALIGGLLMWVAFGITENTRNYISPFFWGLSSEQTGLLIYVIVGSVIFVWTAARAMTQWLGKRRLAIYSMILFGLCEPSAIGLRLMGVLPQNGDPALLPILLVIWFLGFSGIIMAMTVLWTMFADVTDEHELATGLRQEGLLYSAGTFSQKMALGGGGLLATAMLYAADFPSNAAAAHVTPEAIWKIGCFTALVTAVFAWLTAYFFSRFTLTREQHEQVLAELRARRAAAPAPVEPQSDAAAVAVVAAARAEI